MTQLPQPSAALIPPPNRRELRRIAVRQKVILACILVYVPALVLAYVLSMTPVLLPGLAVLAAMVVGTVFVFLLAMELYGSVVGAMLGILTLLPLVGLIALLIVNSKATAILRAGGVRVGLLGADMRGL